MLVLSWMILNNPPSQDDVASNSFRPCEHLEHLDLAMLKW
jgi:hypothetical protein